MKRSKMNLSAGKLMTGKMGLIYPICCVEIIPGDTIEHVSNIFARALPLSSPPMHRVNMQVHHWFVPFRLIWDDWESFITGGEDGLDASVFPTIDFSGAAVAESDLADYFGIPPGFAHSTSALPFRAYNLIFDEWYRDQDLITKSGFSKASGADATTPISLKYRCWEKDYLTTCRPWELKGASLTLPLGTSAPVNSVNGTSALGRKKSDDSLMQTGTLSIKAATGELVDIGSNVGYIDPNGSLVADLSGATGVDINTVRQYFALQRYQEARARYGSRYTEYLAYLGVRSSDARLQRPEYLGGGKQVLSFSEVLQTASTTADANGVGQLYGHGIASLRSNRYRKFFEEHGYVISTLSVLPQTMYPDGIPRTFNRRVKEDFWQKELQHIGQQEVLMKEVYALGANPDSVFGYQDRYDEYRRQESSIAGAFRTTMNDWHFARLLGAEPAINEAFVSSADVTQRCFQDTSGPSMAFNIRNNVIARRMIAARGSSFVL